MINEIIDAISVALGACFGDGYKIYTENIEQGLEEPCFIITSVNPSRRLFFGKRYFSQNMFCIQYFPSTDEQQTECNAILDRLYDCLEYIVIHGDFLRGTKMYGEQTDNILSFFVNYNDFTIKSNQNQSMEELEYEANAGR